MVITFVAPLKLIKDSVLLRQLTVLSTISLKAMIAAIQTSQVSIELIVHQAKPLYLLLSLHTPGIQTKHVLIHYHHKPLYTHRVIWLTIIPTW